MAAERRNRKWNARVYDSFPIRDWDRWLDDRRPTLVVQTLEPGAQPKDVLAGSQLVAGAGFAGQWGSGSDTIAATWTPDGRGLVFAATTNRNEAAFADVAQPLWLVAAAGGEPKRLTPGADSYAPADLRPRWQDAVRHRRAGDRSGLQRQSAGRVRLGGPGGPASSNGSSPRLARQCTPDVDRDVRSVGRHLRSVT